MGHRFCYSSGTLAPAGLVLLLALAPCGHAQESVGPSSAETPDAQAPERGAAGENATRPEPEAPAQAAQQPSEKRNDEPSAGPNTTPEPASAPQPAAESPAAEQAPTAPEQAPAEPPVAEPGAEAVTPAAPAGAEEEPASSSERVAAPEAPEPAAPAAEGASEAPSALETPSPEPRAQRRAPTKSPAKPAHGVRTVSGAELAKLGFFQDFEELDLEQLLSADVKKVTTSLATGRDLALDEAPASVTVLSADDLGALGVSTLVEALRLVAGFDVVADALGRNRIVARGIPTGGLAALSEGVLILLNGRRLNEGLSGGATAVNLDIPITAVTRIEILRGPASSLYGAGALGGVVNIITAEAGSFRGVRLASSFGSFVTQQQTLSVGNMLGDLSVVATIRLGTTQGAQIEVPADAQTARDAIETRHTSLAPGKTQDDGRLLETLYRISYRGFELNWRVYQESTDVLIGYANALGDQNRITSQQSLFDLSYSREETALGTLRARLGLNQTDQRQVLSLLPPGLEGAFPDGRTFKVESGVYLQTALKWRRGFLEGSLERDLGTDHQLGAGLELAREGTHDLQALSNVDLATGLPLDRMTDIPGAVADHQRSNLGFYVQDRWRASANVTLTGGARLDWIEGLGAQLSPRAALVARLPQDLSLKVLYGRGFRAPTFAELYLALPGFQGNPALRPVTAQTFETALALQRPNLKLSLGGYWNRLRDTIPGDLPGSPFARTALVNTPGLDVLGLELEGQATLGAHSVFGNCTVQRPRLAEGGGTAPDIPARLLTLGANLALGTRTIITPTWTLRSSRPRAEGDPRPAVPAYGLFNVTVRAQRVYKELGLDASLFNLLGQRYADPAPASTVPGDYPQPGRSFQIRAHYDF
jgi:outer membrane receptor for ferrienterochelin and colicins